MEENVDSVVQEALIDLYLNVKVRNSDEISKYDEKKLEEEREELKETDSLVLIEYIKIGRAHV